LNYVLKIIHLRCSNFSLMFMIDHFIKTTNYIDMNF
jgi:hypothetical protein